MAEPARAKPKPTPETQHFWDGTQAGELRLQRCDLAAPTSSCRRARFAPPAARATSSSSRAAARASSTATSSITAPAPGFEDTAPYGICIVELDEGPR